MRVGTKLWAVSPTRRQLRSPAGPFITEFITKLCRSFERHPYNSRQWRVRWPGWPTAFHEMTNKPADEINRRAKHAARYAAWIAIPALFISMLGLGGGAYCDYRARLSPLAPNYFSGNTNGINFKAQRAMLAD